MRNELSFEDRGSYHGVLAEAPLNQIRPKRWLKNWLQLQKEGLTGHLDVAGFPFDTELWACEGIGHQSGAPWWPYEQTAYWVDGLLRCGVLLQDPELMRRGEEQCQYVLENRDTDGYLGPKSCKPPMVAGRWSHSVFFRALMAFADLGHEREIAEALAQHFLGHEHDHSGHRDVCCVEQMCWAYEQTGDKRLLELAERTWQQFQEKAVDDDTALKAEVLAKDEPADCHGVTFCETLKIPVLLYLITGKQAYLDTAADGFRKIDRHHMLVTGAPSSTESLRGVTALDAHETCDIADYTWAAGYMLLATGDSIWADKIERACFNALPAAVTKDFRALQYFSSPNQFVLMENSTHTLAAAGGKFMTYRPRPGTECCTAQVNRPMPNFGARMWMLRGGEPVAAFYGPSTFAFEVGNSQVQIDEQTEYPFEETVRFHLRCNSPAQFKLWLRIPAWTKGAQLRVNGEACEFPPVQKGYFALDREWNDGDVVELVLPMQLKLQSWPDNGVSIEYGPLVFALPIKDERRADPNDPYQNEDFPAWGMRPISDWNFGLELDQAALDQAIEVVRSDSNGNPWESPRISLKLNARRIPGWGLRQTKELESLGGELVDPERNKWRLFTHVIKGEFLLTPPLPGPELREKALRSPEESITLIPVGCTCLRMTIFPNLKSQS